MKDGMWKRDTFKLIDRSPSRSREPGDYYRPGGNRTGKRDHDRPGDQSQTRSADNDHKSSHSRERSRSESAGFEDEGSKTSREVIRARGRRLRSRSHDQDQNIDDTEDQKRTPSRGRRRRRSGSSDESTDGALVRTRRSYRWVEEKYEEDISHAARKHSRDHERQLGHGLIHIRKGREMIQQHEDEVAKAREERWTAGDRKDELLAERRACGIEGDMVNFENEQPPAEQRGSKIMPRPEKQQAADIFGDQLRSEARSKEDSRPAASKQASGERSTLDNCLDKIRAEFNRCLPAERATPESAPKSSGEQRSPTDLQPDQQVQAQQALIGESSASATVQSAHQRGSQRIETEQSLTPSVEIQHQSKLPPRPIVPSLGDKQTNNYQILLASSDLDRRSRSPEVQPPSPATSANQQPLAGGSATPQSTHQPRSKTIETDEGPPPSVKNSQHFGLPPRPAFPNLGDQQNCAQKPVDKMSKQQRRSQSPEVRRPLAARTVHRQRSPQQPSAPSPGAENISTKRSSAKNVSSRQSTVQSSKQKSVPQVRNQKHKVQKSANRQVLAPKVPVREPTQHAPRQQTSRQRPLRQHAPQQQSARQYSARQQTFQQHSAQERATGYSAAQRQPALNDHTQMASIQDQLQIQQSLETIQQNQTHHEQSNRYDFSGQSVQHNTQKQHTDQQYVEEYDEERDEEYNEGYEEYHQQQQHPQSCIPQQQNPPAFTAPVQQQPQQRHQQQSTSYSHYYDNSARDPAQFTQQQAAKRGTQYVQYASEQYDPSVQRGTRYGALQLQQSGTLLEPSHYPMQHSSGHGHYSQPLAGHTGGFVQQQPNAVYGQHAQVSVGHDHQHYDQQEGSGYSGYSGQYNQHQVQGHAIQQTSSQMQQQTGSSGQHYQQSNDTYLQENNQQYMQPSTQQTGASGYHGQRPTGNYAYKQQQTYQMQPQTHGPTFGQPSATYAHNQQQSNTYTTQQSQYQAQQISSYAPPDTQQQSQQPAPCTPQQAIQPMQYSQQPKYNSGGNYNRSQEAPQVHYNNAAQATQQYQSASGQQYGQVQQNNQVLHKSQEQQYPRGQPEFYKDDRGMHVQYSNEQQYAQAQQNEQLQQHAQGQQYVQGQQSTKLQPEYYQDRRGTHVRYINQQP